MANRIKYIKDFKVDKEKIQDLLNRLYRANTNLSMEAYNTIVVLSSYIKEYND